ncbi:hypothetical protein [Alicyclobacillus sp. SP_1]|jgi:hypothetical protein|nr:hypothetical protein [Alicyclobacillus sp. SP_1]
MNDARSFVMGPTPIFARLLDWLQWRRMIDERVGRDDFKVTVGRRVEA